ncbi:DMT family transporter [Actinomycetospora straminea]|uniref:Transporter family-2 protein n=1 Tax=Actinomycetospora straminea TaxID=663607 RepID=A0ABP9E153_9PSEU|nr:DMT family transporter [Actinomycetospora straminea]MDD7931174.1 DMT family transporter [Actinomycetospora straminea]
MVAPRTALGLVGAVVTGGFTVAQARVNAELGVALGDGVLAAIVSFGLGLVLLLVLLALLPAGRRGLRRVRVARRRGTLRPWQLLGGLGGALLVAGQGLTAHVLGTALFTIAVVAGQASGGLVVDRAGLGPAGPRRTTPPRVLGAVLMLGAVVLSVAPSVSTEAPVVLALLPLAAGVAAATQQALNGRVAAAAGGASGPGASGAGATGTADAERAGDEPTEPTEPTGDDASPDGRDSVVASVLPAATINFVVGLAALLVAGLVAVLVTGPPNPFPSAWYLYLGGPFGAIFIGLGAWVVGQVGVLLLSLGAVAGQIVGSLAIDLAIPSSAGTPGVTTVLGAALTLVAAGVASAPWPLPRRRSGPRGRSAPRDTGSDLPS